MNTRNDQGPYTVAGRNFGTPKGTVAKKLNAGERLSQ